MAKIKTTVNLEHTTLEQAEKVRKLLGIKTFSQFNEFVLRKHCWNPTELIKDQIRNYQRELLHLQNILNSVTDLEQEKIVVNLE